MKRSVHRWGSLLQCGYSLSGAWPEGGGGRRAIQARRGYAGAQFKHILGSGAVLVILLLVVPGLEGKSGDYRVDWTAAKSNGWANPLGRGAVLSTSTAFDFNSDVYAERHEGKRHTGVDVRHGDGETVYAIAKGSVAKVERGTTPMGMVIIIRHESSAGGFFAVYGHVEAHKGIKVGSDVIWGQELGLVRKAGDPSHLHFGINTSSKLEDFLFGTKPKEHGWGRVPKDTDPRQIGWVDPFKYLGDSYNPDPVVRALRWLRESQREDGSWGGSTGITALVLLAFLNAGVAPDDPVVNDGLAYLVNPRRFDMETGRFSGDVRGDYPCYTYDTALGILALVAAEDRDQPRSDYRAIVAKARDYLLSIQYSNPDNPDDPQTGGWGYPAPGWTDLSNTQWVVMALDAAYDYLGEVKPVPTDANSWTGKLLRYLGQCQAPDGGFGYRPGQPSWGSMSAAGLWSLVLAGVDVSDTRVVAVLRWISGNYRLDANPARGLKALYYYHTTLSKALTMADLWEVTTPDGRKHDWYAELAAYLEGLQSKEGYWVNSDQSEWEGNRDLCTAYSILALQAQKLPSSSDKQLSWVLTLHSPAELHVYDWLGRHVGRNEKTGRIDAEIPGSSYSVGAQGEQVITLSLPQAGRYRIEVVGTGTGSFTLESKGYLGERTVSSGQITGTISKGRVKAAMATLTALVGPLTVHIGELRSVPHGLAAVPGKNCVDLSWRSYQEDGFELTGYAIYRSTTSRVGYTKVVVVSGTQTSYRDTSVVAGITYYYVITAIGSDDKETPFSREASATPLGTFAGAITVGPNPVGADGCAFFYVLPDGARRAAVLIFDVTGRKVAEVSLDPTATRYPATGRWSPVNANGIPLANGPYAYVLLADDKVIGQGKMVIQR